MRVMVMIKANADTEAGVMPSEKLLAEMGNYNEELVEAGIMKAGEGLHPSSRGARILFKNEERKVVDGPFAEKSFQEAIDWAKRIPNPTGEEGIVELRPVFEDEDFGAEFTPELREQEERLRRRIEADEKR